MTALALLVHSRLWNKTGLRPLVCFRKSAAGLCDVIGSLNSSHGSRSTHTLQSSLVTVGAVSENMSNRHLLVMARHRLIHAGLNEDNKPLQADVRFLRQHQSMKFTIEGHCDERGLTEYTTWRWATIVLTQLSRLWCSSVSLPTACARLATARKMWTPLSLSERPNSFFRMSSTLRTMKSTMGCGV